jgi:predicted secreted protein
MNLTGGIVLFAVIWFITFFVVLPIRFRSQEEEGDVVPGTPRSAPADAQIATKAKITTAIAVVLWAIIAWVILSGAVTIHDLDWFGRLGPEN